MPIRRYRPHKKSRLQVAGLTIDVTRKRMKTIRLKVSPPDGKISVSAPFAASDRDIHSMVSERLGWIQQQQHTFQARPRLQVRSGEHHQLWGQPLALTVTTGGRRRCHLAPSGELTLQVLAGDDEHQRAAQLDAFYREQLQPLAARYLAHWQPIVGRRISFWGIRKMKTRWGSCNIQRARVWLNLELAKYPQHCLEYVVVHELVHLHESGHNARFYGLLDQFHPQWRAGHQLLRNGEL